MQLAPHPQWPPEPGVESAAQFEQLCCQVGALEERVLSAGRTARLVQDFCERADDRAASCTERLDARLQAMEHRVEQMELGQQMPVSRHQEAFVGDLRAELSRSAATLNQELAKRLDEMRSWQEDFETELRHSMSEALQTCSRLADDSLAASEATQLKLDDFRARTEAAQAGAKIPAAVADAQRCADECGGQILRLGSALRRVVQVQREQQQEYQPQAMWSAWKRYHEDWRSSPIQGAVAQAGAREERTTTTTTDEGNVTLRRNAMIVALYEELQLLEESLSIPSVPMAAIATSQVGRPLSGVESKRSPFPPRRRRARSHQPITGRGRQIERTGSISLERILHHDRHDLHDGHCGCCSRGGR